MVIELTAEQAQAVIRKLRANPLLAGNPDDPLIRAVVEKIRERLEHPSSVLRI